MNIGARPAGFGWTRPEGVAETGRARHRGKVAIRAADRDASPEPLDVYGRPVMPAVG